MADVDLLVVLDRQLPLTRSLYAPWSRALEVDGRPVEALRFAGTKASCRRASGPR
jgi:hypothetical protein